MHPDQSWLVDKHLKSHSSMHEVTVWQLEVLNVLIYLSIFYFLFLPCFWWFLSFSWSIFSFCRISYLWFLFLGLKPWIIRTPFCICWCCLCRSINHTETPYQLMWYWSSPDAVRQTLPHSSAKSSTSSNSGYIKLVPYSEVIRVLMRTFHNQKR